MKFINEMLVLMNIREISESMDLCSCSFGLNSPDVLVDTADSSTGRCHPNVDVPVFTPAGAPRVAHNVVGGARVAVVADGLDGVVEGGTAG